MHPIAAISWEDFLAIWSPVATAAHIALATFASAHVVLRKRDTRAAIGWAGLIWFSPLFGAALYWGFGINRIRRKAHLLRGQPYGKLQAGTLVGTASSYRQGVEKISLLPLATLVGHVTQLPLLEGNRIELLTQDDDPHGQMLAAIDAAEKSVALATYIFDNDATGQRFVESLGQAVARGVQVRVLIDGIGMRYSRPNILRRLRERNVPVERFLYSMIPFWSPYSNLRNHRKIMVADGKLGFTGGMNIRRAKSPDAKESDGVHDAHFRVEGPVVSHLRQTFADDWLFCKEETLAGEAWFPPLAPLGQVEARGIPDGPDENVDKLHLAIMGALACAQSSVYIVTPYFLPDAALISALNVAALRGVAVNIVLPKVNNLALVQWAATAQFWQVLQRGCRVWLSPPPFDHSKLMVVDRAWSLVGSGNWDPRSLRLNFEFNLECYDSQLAGQIVRLIESKLRRAEEITLAEVDGRSLPIRLRDGLARLLSPYL
ncbi:MAG: phospholipase D-like domain-containing protein [Pirellulales bacterium]